MCIKYNQIKNGKKSQSQKVNWLMRNLAQVIISAEASSLVPQYRCCCKSSRWWHILIFALSLYNYLHNFCEFFNFIDIFNCIESSLNFKLLQFKF